MARENEHLKSLREWWIRVLQRWWEVLGTFLSLATALGGIIAFAIWARRIESPLPWWNIGFVVGGALLFLIISFLAFHRMRIERDNLKSDKPILFIRSGGWARLANDITANYQRVLLHYEVIITNPSQSVPLGIQRIVLTWGKVDGATRPIAAYTPVVGKIEIKDGEHEPKIKEGEIGNTLYLQPNEAKSGQLVFIGEISGYFIMGEFNAAIIWIYDSQGNKYKYDAHIDDILSNPSKLSTSHKEDS